MHTLVLHLGLPRDVDYQSFTLRLNLNDIPNIFSPELHCSLFADDSKISLHCTFLYESYVLHNEFDVQYKLTTQLDLTIDPQKWAVLYFGFQIFPIMYISVAIQPILIVSKILVLSFPMIARLPNIYIYVYKQG